MKNQKSISEIVFELTTLTAEISRKENPDQISALATECGTLYGILSMLSNTKENQEILQIALANLQKRA